MDYKEIGYCGLYCGGCSAYQATKSGDFLKDDDGTVILCDGCNSDRVTVWCTDCKIKACNKRKGYRYCIECEENPCNIMIEFMNEPKYPYHLEVQKDMMKMKEIGMENWIMEKEKQYHCSKCNHLVNWFEDECSACGETSKKSAWE